MVRPQEALMITGAHSIIYTTDADSDRVFLRDVLGLPFVDEGGWPIFGLPPAEVAFHPADVGGKHEFHLICADIEVFISAMNDKGVQVTPPHEEPWGIITEVTLPSGAKLGVYQARHQRPDRVKRKAAKKAAKKAARKVAKRKADVEKSVKKEAKAKKKATQKAAKALKQAAQATQKSKRELEKAKKKAAKKATTNKATAKKSPSKSGPKRKS